MLILRYWRHCKYFLGKSINIVRFQTSFSKVNWKQSNGPVSLKWPPKIPLNCIYSSELLRTQNLEVYFSKLQTNIYDENMNIAGYLHCVKSWKHVNKHLFSEKRKHCVISAVPLSFILSNSCPNFFLAQFWRSNYSCWQESHSVGFP